MKISIRLAATAILTYAAGSSAATAVSIPTGQQITPTAAQGSTFADLNPNLPDRPAYTAGQAVTSLLSPDGKTLLVLTSGYNLVEDATGRNIDQDSQEYVFVFDVSKGAAVQKQALAVPNTFSGLVFAPDGKRFYAAGGVDDSIHVFSLAGGTWAEDGAPIALNNGPGNGLTQGVPGVAGPTVGPQAAGLDVTADGLKLVVANYENDSISVVDLATRKAIAALDLRPGKIDPAQAGVPGGEFPYWVRIRGNSTAYVSSVRDREIVVVDLSANPRVVKRIAVEGNPNKMILDADQSRLFVASDNSDAVLVIDTRINMIVQRIATTAPEGLVEGSRAHKGSSPNSLALSPDQRKLYVTNGGSNSVAVIALDDEEAGVEGLIPTGWYPNSVSVSRDGRTLYVVNGKSNAGPNPTNCTVTSPAGANPACPQNGSGNQYVWQLTKAGLLTLPVQRGDALEALSRQVAFNNGFNLALSADDRKLMDELRSRIHHVIYIVKENRTYDQILGDLGRGNGDPGLTQFGKKITPNFHALASGFVNLDNFYCSGEVSMDGWQWSTAARSADANEKTTPVNYAGRGASYDSEGAARDINVALPTSAERHAADPINPLDPDLLPGTANEVELDGPDGEPGAGYIWNAALRAGKSVRNYGFFLDLTLLFAPPAFGGLPVERDPHAAGLRVAYPAHPSLLGLTDPYFRGFDSKLPDFYRYQEWAREFDGYVATGDLPALSLVRLMNDHMGSFSQAIDGVNTPETQQADNDYAAGLLVQKVARSRYASDTLIFVLEDDSQDGPDHVDAHRSTAYVVGPYVKQGALVSARYSTVNMLRTIEDVLGLEHLNLHDRGVRPMTEVFDLKQARWSFVAKPSDILRGTALPLPQAPAGASVQDVQPTHDAAWWAAKTKDFDFTKEDRIDAARFNRVLWEGLMGDRPYPARRASGGATK
jgi:YVTN family beta-propeller protein